MTEFEAILNKINSELKASQGSDRTIRYTTKDGREVTAHAFIAGGCARPGSFRSTWFIDGEKMNKNAARSLLAGRA